MLELGPDGSALRAAFVEDEATKRAIAASLRDQQEQEERARRQQPGAPARELLGANGAPTALKGGTIGWVAPLACCCFMLPSSLRLQRCTSRVYF